MLSGRRPHTTRVTDNADSLYANLPGVITLPHWFRQQGYAAARLTALAILSSLKRAIGDLDRVTAWLRVFGMVNTAPDFNLFPSVINGFSDLILSLYGPERGDHARSAVGMAGLPFGTPVEIEAEVEFRA